MEYPEELIQIAEFHGGELMYSSDEFYVRIDTGDRTSRENYEEVVDMREDIELILEDANSDYIIQELWADHDTQIIEFQDKKDLDE